MRMILRLIYWQFGRVAVIVRQQIDLLPVVDSIKCELPKSFILPGFGVV